MNGVGRGRSSSDSRALLLLADGALASGDCATAAQLFAEAEDGAHDWWTQAQGAFGRACAQRAAGDSAAAYAHADRALGLLPDDFTGVLSGQIVLSRSHCLCDVGQPEAAESGFRRAAETFRQHGLSAEEQQAQVGLGWCLALQGNDDQAAAVFERLVLSQHAIIRSQALNNFAIMLERAGDFDQSADLLNRDLALARQLDDAHGQVVTQINLARVLLAAGRVDEARDVAVAALALADRSPIASSLKQRAADAVAASR
jgi:tetratricopeptide (TPR) repeat protein